MFVNVGPGLELHESGLLSTAARLDRELKAHIPFQLVCTINGPFSTDATITTLITIDQNMTLVVEDEDDNPPSLQNPNEQQIIDVYLKDQGIIQVKKKIKDHIRFQKIASYECHGNAVVLIVSLGNALSLVPWF